MNIIAQVARFMKCGGQETTVTDMWQTQLYHDLIKEENKEWQDAVKANDVVEEFDADLDILYVTVGRLISRWGVQAVLDGFEEVQRSNMSKFEECSHCEGKNNVAHFTKAPHLFTVHECPECEGGLKAIRREDGKLLKGVNYFKPNLKAILEKHGLEIGNE